MNYNFDSNNFSYSEDVDWSYMPDYILLHIFGFLSVEVILQASLVCKSWYRISRDECLWKHLFQNNFKINKKIGILPGAKSWYSEYKRLSYHVPLICTEWLKDHSHQVLHVSFSNNGKLFATCSKDGYILVWKSNFPATILYQYDMKAFSWKYTQFSQFNANDTLLLVSGVYFGTPPSTSGEIAVFSLQGGFALQCRIINKPYDIFGVWFSDQYLLSGDLRWLGHLVSTSILWLNKANQESVSEHVPIVSQMFKFYNMNASSIRSIMIANCRSTVDNELLMKTDDATTKFNTESNIRDCKRNVYDDSPFNSLSKNHDGNSFIQYNEDYRKNEIEEQRAMSSDSDTSTQNCSTSSSCSQLNIDNIDDVHENEIDICKLEYFSEDEIQSENEVLLAKGHEKYLIFTTGSKTYTPHQIGFKKIKHVVFPKKLDPGLTLRERIARQREQNNQPAVELDWLDYEAVQDRFDKVDHLIDLHGHIIGMGLSPDHRYLYVNSRPWPEGYSISNPLEPPPIAQEIDIHVIDLSTLKQVGTMLRAHKAYTPNTECFFIFLDVSKQYVASGAEDRHGYLWDRHYGICLVKYPHKDVVNSVAFNPKDPSMLVTTSDDHTIKVWRSLHKAKKLAVDLNSPRGLRLS